MDLLTNLRALRFLAPFLDSEHTLSSAATAAERPVSSTVYWLRRFVRHGLVVKTGRIERAGMAMPTYRAAARQLVVPLERLPVERRVALLDEGRLRVLRRFLDGLDEAMAADGVGGLRVRASDGPNGVAIEADDDDRSGARWTDSWGVVRLSAERAEALVREMEEIATRYSAGGDRNGRRFVVHVGIAPDPRHRWRSADDR